MTRDEAWLLREKYHGEKTEDFLADCDRLRAGEPLAYVIGFVPFLGTTISLESHPLIPRPETEFWVERALRELPSSGGKFLDLCAGSGCIGVALLAHLPNATVDFAEIDEAHHATILKNVRENGIDHSHARVVGGDLFENIGDTYDAIFANPPYIDPAFDRTEASVRKYEPHRALYGGADGLALILRIIREAGEHITEGDMLFIEHEPEQVEEIRKRAEEAGFGGETWDDQYGTPRCTRLTRLR